MGLGFSIRRIRLLGAEEIGQGVVSAAMVGALVAFTLLLDSTVSSLVPQSALPACASVQSPAGSPFGFYSCNLEALGNSLSGLSSSLSRAADISGFASSLKVSVGVVSAQPFFAAEAASRSLSDASAQAQALSALSFFEFEMNEFIRSSALAVFLPAGLILRTFFATRKLGAAAMGIAIAAYVVYPLLFLYTFTISQSLAASSEATAHASSFNSQFASLPLLDLDQTGAVRDQIGAMSQGDFGGKIQQLFPSSSRALSLAGADLVIFPIVSLIVSAVAALELYRTLSAPILLPYFESV
ncbi:Uncharacterised protein [uncultured archaeon]|nr:Uncharacterised protein [uncultured archaeon]